MAAGGWTSAWGQAERAITIIAPASPGGSLDGVARLVADSLSPLIGRPVVVENKPGGNGSIAYALAARAPADGSVLVLTSSSFAVNPATIKNLSFDVSKDFSGIGGLAQSPVVLVANARFPAQSACDVRTILQQEPGRVTFASPDAAALLATTQLLNAIGAKAPIANYKGGAPAMVDVAGGHVALCVTGLGGAMPLVKAGQVKLLGVMSKTRLKQLPDLPTLIEQGVNVEFLAWWALHTSSRVPSKAIEKLGVEVQRMQANPTFITRLEELYQVPLPLGPADLDAFVAKDVKRMAELALDAGLRPE
jgi:tripartite-type tricarboxylate transporter receptor subunit TctC